MQLLSSIPKMQITELQLYVDRDADGSSWMGEHMVESMSLLAMVRAVKKNSSLRSVVYQGGCSFNDNHERMLNSYFERNQGLSQWIASSATIPRSAWPKAIEAARAIGPHAVVRILHAVSGSVGPGKAIPQAPSFLLT